jgi:phage shock protein PspC (stress-responsive transcriptional regulator)
MSDQQPLAKINRELKAYKNLPDAGPLKGVCAGIAYRLGVPTWLVRVAFIIAALCYGVGLLPYLLIGFLAPDAKTPKDYGERTGAA